MSGLPPPPDVTTGRDMRPSLPHPRKHSWPTSFGPTRTPFSSAVKHLTCAFLVSLPPTHFSPDSLETSASVTPLKQLLAGHRGLPRQRFRWTLTSRPLLSAQQHSPLSLHVLKRPVPVLRDARLLPPASRLLLRLPHCCLLRVGCPGCLPLAALPPLLKQDLLSRPCCHVGKPCGLGTQIPHRPRLRDACRTPPV